jgi:hypothetical protein
MAALAKAIKTYTERVEEQDTINKMHDAIQRAECIVFLGFAYHKQNMRLLFNPLPEFKTTKHIFGTAYGMSDADKSEVVDELAEMFPHYEDAEAIANDDFSTVKAPLMQLVDLGHIHIETNLTCSKLFEHYAKSLAG